MDVAARPTPQEGMDASRRGWRRWEAIRFLCPLERLGAGRSEPHVEAAPCPHCKDTCGSGRSRMDTVIRTFAPGELLSAIGYQLTA